MKSKFLVLSVTAMIIFSMGLLGCKGKVEKPQVEEVVVEDVETLTPLTMEDTISAQQAAQNVIVEPAPGVAVEAIPPTAAVPEALVKSAAQVKNVSGDKNKDIQAALKAAGVYNGAIDGKIGPKTKKAIMDFQKSHGLKADGKVGPKTWAVLEKYLIKQ